MMDAQRIARATWTKTRAGPDGLHLFDRTTGWNVLLDEVRVPPAMWSAAPRQISVALTNSCNLSCPHCYAPKHAAKLPRQPLLSWLRELDAHGCLGVGFGGGEPTLYRGFARLCRSTVDSTGLAVTFTTHGHTFNGRLASELAGCVHFIRVSMDGVGARYETLRGRTFSSFCEHLRVIRDVAPFGINFVVNALTLQDLDAAVTLAGNQGAAELLLLPEQPVRGRGGIDATTTEALQRWVRSYQGEVRLSVSEAGACGLPTCDPLPGERGLRAYAHIDASGVLKRSSYDSVGVHIGPEGVMRTLQTLSDTGADG
jgi:MoaA/NifB/PqqE/SkfB family radical SAM enzyme